MSKLPAADPIPDKPPLHLKGGSIAVASPTSINEACFSVPAVRALRNSRPTATLAVITPESIAPLWQNLGILNHIITFPDRASVRQITKVLKEHELTIESSVAWEASKAAVALAKIRVPQRLGYDRKPLSRRLTDKLRLDDRAGPVKHRVRFYLELMEKLGLEGFVAKNFETPPLPPRPRPPRIGLVPGSTLGSAYCWDLERFAELGKALLSQHQAELVLLAYPGHSNEAAELEKYFVAGSVKNFGDQFDLPGLLDALPYCTFLIANDGAVVHLAAHLGVPTIALFGPGDITATRPLGRQHIVLSQHVECSPCSQPNCPQDQHLCMEELSVSRVLEAATSLLQPHTQPQTEAAATS